MGSPFAPILPGKPPAPVKFVDPSNAATLSLKKVYVEYAARLGKTGNGLRPEEVTAGSRLANIIGKMLCLSHGAFPFWY